MEPASTNDPVARERLIDLVATSPCVPFVTFARWAAEGDASDVASELVESGDVLVSAAGAVRLSGTQAALRSLECRRRAARLARPHPGAQS